MMKSPVSVVALLALAQQAISIHLWDSPADLPTVVPASCRAALAANITCDELIPANMPASLAYLTTSELTSFCTNDCYKSLQAFASSVSTRCKDTILPLNGTNVTASAIAPPLLWAYNTTCSIDSATGSFCYPQISNGTAKPCSDCFLKYEANLLSSDYGRGRLDPPSFSSLLSTCSQPASKFPFQTPSTTIATPSPTGTPLVPTCTGTTYEVKNGDTCRSIASANSIAEDRFITENGIDYGCTTLTPGSSVCLGGKCTLLVVQPNMTCTQILQGKPYYLNQLLSWNPTLHPSCNNLDTMVGRGICVSPPGASDYTISTYTTPSTTSFTMFTGSFVAGDSAVVNPSTITIPVLPTTFSVPTTTYSVNLTQASIIDDYSQYCPISQEFFDDGGSWEDLPDACSTLLEPYCTPNPNKPSPTSTRFPAICTPTITSATPVETNPNAKPSPLTPGTISSCQQYYKVVESDTCYGIATNFGITLDQFNQWNPYPGEDCTRLLLGEYVCVKA